MSRKILSVFGLLVVLSMLLSACGAPAQTPAPANTEAPSSPGSPTEAAPSTEAPSAAPTEAAATTAPTEAPAKSNRLGGWLDKVVFSAVPDAEPAVAQIQAGSLDVYSATIDKVDVFDKVKADSNMGYDNVYGSSNQILFNTTACTDKSKLNPFTDQKIREAMNWAVDRNYIVQEIFGGLAKAKYTPFTTVFPDYARYADLFSAVEAKYAYNFDKAKAVVDAEMPTLGATQGSDGKWQFQGKPVTIIDLIRTEDKRKEIGNYFANQLEKLGFTVERQEKTRKEAAPIWQGDPAPCAFNVYTAGWISPQIYRDEGLNFLNYNTGELQALQVMNAYKPSKELLDVAHKLYTNSFANMDERKQLYKTGLDLSMTESWWGVWINDTVAFEAFNKNAQGASDLAAGFGGGQLYPYTARLAGQEGGTMRVANSAILVDAWNPIAGSNWIDDTIVRNFTTDYGVVFNPYTGLIMPKLVQKADLVAQEGLPITQPQGSWITLNFQKEIAVPDDAWVDWDAKAQKFITAAEKAQANPKWAKTAKTKSTVTYIPDLWKTTWHDGSNLSPADFVFFMIMTFDPGKKDSKIYDESLGATLDTFVSHFKGVKITSTDPLTIETYDDQFQLDAENNIYGKDWYPNFYQPSAFTGGMIAWHNLTPMVQAVADGKMAFSKDASTAKKVDYASQVSGPTLDVQMGYVDKDITDKYIPFAPTLSQYLKADEAVTRYNNLKAFYAAHKHIVLGTGPYMIDQVFPVEQSISEVRYDKYLFPADQFAGFGEPELMTVAVDGPTTLAAGDEATFDVTINFKDQPYPSKDIDRVSYTLFNANGDILATGTAENTGEGTYTATLGKDVTSKLDAGTSKLIIAASSKTVSLPAFETTEFVVTK
ncbi:MAG TPA: ABC transporter substrate-binding protein [Anaerolineaceae bacterium]|nr:ABC transporter substrate-binding protein [Anaerolineaceae bacterium]